MLALSESGILGPEAMDEIESGLLFVLSSAVISNSYHSYPASGDLQDKKKHDTNLHE